MTLNHVCCALCPIFCSALLAGQPSTSVTAVVFAEDPYSRVALHEMTREADQILKHSGIRLNWMFGEAAPVVNGLLVVVKLRGHCDMDGPAAKLLVGPLGWSYAVNGTVLPFSDLACDNIRGSVQAALLPDFRSRANILLGRAMGRVLAHELYHIVADTSEHGQEGVAKAALSPRQLTSGPLELQPAENAAMLNGLYRAR